MAEVNDQFTAKQKVDELISKKYPKILTPEQYKAQLAEKSFHMVGADAIYAERYYQLFIEIEHGTQEEVNKLLNKLEELLQ